MDWETHLGLISQNDPWYQECLAELNRREPAYQQILASLTPEQQDALEFYISACEELRHAQTLLAYTLGKLAGI